MTPTTRRLQEVHANLWGSHKPASILSKSYIALLLNEFTCKLWGLMLRSKDEFFNAFKLWLPRAKAGRNKLDYLETDNGKVFISIALQSFCQERGIKIGYIASYIHKENGITEQCWRIFAQMKDSLFIDSKLPNQFWTKAIDTANYL